MRLVNSRSAGYLVVIALVPTAASISVARAADDATVEPPAVEFQRDVRPILSANCFQCHGPDQRTREADLRLDTREGLLGEKDASGAASGGVVVGGDLDGSELYSRITDDDPDVRMPPADSGKQLTDSQIATLRRWIQQGASWRGHWAFEPPRRPPLPETQDLGDWISTPIDAFVAARLERESLRPSPAASPVTLVRRVHLDLTGLPPTIEQADAFLEDAPADRLRKLVERLLSSPHYGEKWARHWLDAARYADSDGFEKDKPRNVWTYRDWVIRAINRDMPYDRFVIEQIAGDLLPKATQDQRIATGFLRNSMLNEEGGIDPEQFRMEAMFDRMDAVGKAVLGLTIQCGQCHNHKYDPLTQTEYYRMFAFLNDSHESNVTVYPDEQLAERERVLAEVEAIENDLKRETPDWPRRLQEWTDRARGDQPRWNVLKLENANDNSQRYLPQADDSLLAQGYAPTRYTSKFTAASDEDEVFGFRLEVLTDPNLPAGGPGRSVDGLLALTEFRVETRGTTEGSKWRTIKLVRATTDYANDRMQLGEPYADRQGKRGFTGPAEYAIDGDDSTAWGIDAGPGRRNRSRKVVFVCEENAAVAGGTRFRFHLGQMHGGWNSDDNQNMNLGRFRISATSARAATADPLPADVRETVESGRKVDQLSDEERGRMFSYWRTTVDRWSEYDERIERLWRRHPLGTTQLVLASREAPRPTHRLERGDFLKPAERVEPGTPGFLHSFHPEGPPDRLDFARWLVDRRSSTTARAIVNRVWQSYFGIGLVESSEDLGSQATAPSHPELLDWLAVEFMENGWSLKWLHRQIILSSTYRQSSRVTPQLLEQDPANRLLARGPRVRLDAELVRDGALAAAGLLNREVGGPGVFPPAPDFLFQPPASYGPKSWHADTGPDKYRRALYTFRFRSVPYPVMSVFDAPPGDASCIRRSRSNTPLQALTTLNEPLFVECARALAERTTSRAGSDDEQRLTFVFRNCLTRPPSRQDLDVLREFLESAREHFSRPENRELAAALVARESDTKAGAGDAGDGENDEENNGERDEAERADLAAEIAERAAWIATCRVVLNLDETITKE